MIDKKQQEYPLCYLCGNTIADKELDEDHVPPKLIFPKGIRDGLQLCKMPTHSTCNNAFSKDEEYFRQSFGVLAHESPTGKHLVKDIIRTIKRPDKLSLSLKILNEFDERPGGIYLPYNKVAKKIDGKRIRRVIWKIIRGLFYYENKIILPERTLCKITIVPPGDKPPDIFGFLAPKLSKGKYGAIFDYKYMEHCINKINETVHFWGLLFWDQIIIMCGFHDPRCNCDKCTKMKQE